MKIKQGSITIRWLGVRAAAPLGLFLLLAASPLYAQLFTNLQALGRSYPVGDPTVHATNSIEGPKGICTADFNNDAHPDLAVANIDGSITILRGIGEGKFEEPLHYQASTFELRAIVAGDLTGDGRPDIATVSPYAGQVYLFVNHLSGFGAPTVIDAWPGARNLATGDFNGDGLLDLIVAGNTNGIQQWQSQGGGFFVVVTNQPIAPSIIPELEFPKPVFAMQSFRPAGANRDELIVTHAESSECLVLAPNEESALEVRGIIPTLPLHALAVGALTEPADSGHLDLIGASRDDNNVQIFRGEGNPTRFETDPIQSYRVPGGPRSVAIADLNGDNWNDVVVVVRNFDRVFTFLNSNGVLMASKEMPVGRSPRELVLADFNNDQIPDAAVMNRDSMNVSILLTFPGEAGFAGLDMLYPVDGQISGLTVFDFNNDGHDDVMQLHRASGEVSLRLADEDGTLGPPTILPMGSAPSSQTLVDVNNDGLVDIITANLGRGSRGSIYVRLSLGDGQFGPEKEFALPDQFSGGLFAVVAGDFDKDGNVDVAAGFFDCRIAFFQGHGDGTFTFERAHLFVFEARVMVTGDFDQDGDVDIAGAGYAGDVLVVENLGDLLTTLTLTRHEYPPPSSNKAGTRDILTTDLNQDGDLDLVIGTGHGAMIYLGREGIAFERIVDTVPGTEFPAGGVALGDFDGNGQPDLAISCQLLNCISILTLVSNNYALALSVEVPSGMFLATGDLDGDGLADLVGSGEVLWTALSSRPARRTEPLARAAGREPLPQLVINEILAINNRWPLPSDGHRNVDWVELFNGKPTSTSLNGFILRLTTATATNDFRFPPTAFMSPRSHLLAICDEERRTVYHTGFRLPGNGATLRLIDPTGHEVDRIEYGAQQENVSYARYLDGVPALVSNPYPSPGAPNEDNGAAEPEVKLTGFDPSYLAPQEPIRFAARGQDDLGIVSVAMIYQRLDIADNTPRRVQFYDDGMHNDGGVLDGSFAGTLEPGLPAGAEIQFYIEAVDLSGKIIYLPDEPVFARNSQSLTLHTLALGVPVPGLEISEVLAWNTNGLRNELNELSDWVEVRNCSTAPIALDQLEFAQEFFGSSSRFHFQPGGVLQPGEHRIIFCDNDSDISPKHAPFALNRNGDMLMVTARGPNGARSLVDWVNFSVQKPNVSLARIGCGGSWFALAPTPDSANAESILGIPSLELGLFTLAFPTEPGKTYYVEETHSLAPISWRALPPIAGDGIEKAVTQILRRQKYLRIHTN